MKPPYTTNFDLAKRQNRFRNFANGILWAIAFVIFLAVIGGGAFGADLASERQSTPYAFWLLVIASLTATATVAYYFCNEIKQRRADGQDDTLEWLKKVQKARLYMKPETCCTDVPPTAPAADLTLASARACHDSQFASGGIIPKDFYVQPLGQPYAEAKGVETGRDERGVCTYCKAAACEVHLPGCFYVRPTNLIERPVRPCRASDIPEAHALLSNHINEMDTLLAEPGHFDDLCVDAYAEAIKAELKVAREEKGRGGWYDTEAFTDEQLKLALKLVMRRGDVVSIGAYAMMLHHRGILHFS